MARIGIDTGGTFTDLVVAEGNQAVTTTKSLTTHDDLANGLLKALDKAGVAGGDLERIVHGTTVALNAILTRWGASVGLITTRGFRDLLDGPGVPRMRSATLVGGDLTNSGRSSSAFCGGRSPNGCSPTVGCSIPSTRTACSARPRIHRLGVENSSSAVCKQALDAAKKARLLFVIIGQKRRIRIETHSRAIGNKRNVPGEYQSSAALAGTAWGTIMNTGSLRRVRAALAIISLAASISGCGSGPAPKATSPAVQVPSPAAPSVTVASVHDAATIVLTDGTRLRQVGISAPNPDSCQAKQATATADSAVHQGALTYQLFGQLDVYGNQWAYIRIDGVDFGEKLASTGWVWAYPDSPAPQSYNQRITTLVDTARAANAGLFGPTCPPSNMQGTAPPAIATEASQPGYRLEATTSTGGKIIVSYGMNGTSATETINGTWTKALPEPPPTGFSFNIFTVQSLDFSGRTTTVTCRVLRDGKVVKEQSATGQTAAASCAGF